MKILLSYFQQFSLPNVRKTRLQADFVKNNQILVVKIIKIRSPLLFQHPPPPLLDFMNFSDPLCPCSLRLPPPLPPPIYSGIQSKYHLFFRTRIFIFRLIFYQKRKNSLAALSVQQVRLGIRNGKDELDRLVFPVLLSISGTSRSRNSQKF